MKTRDILQTPEALLVPQLKQLKLKELERHAEKLIRRKGGADYKTVLSATIKALPGLSGDEKGRFDAVQLFVSEQLGHNTNKDAENDDLIARIATLLGIIIAEKFQRIHRQTP